MEMKILYVFDKMPATYQQYLMNLLNGIKVFLNIKTLAFSGQSNPDYIVNSYGLRDTFQRILFKLKLSKHKSIQFKIFNKFDIIHLQHSFLFSKITPLFELKNKPKIVITLRGGDTYLKPWIDKRWRNFYQNYGFKIDAFITMSNHQKDYLIKWGVPDHKIYISPISFDMSLCKNPKYPNKTKLKLISAFRLTWEKNIEGIVLLSQELKNRNIDFVYDIYGDGPELAKLLFLIDKFKLINYVSVKGKINNANLIELYSQYDFTVQLSLSESLSMSVIESQSQGTPCVVSNTGGLPEAVDPGKSAIVSDFNNFNFFADEIIRLYKNDSLYYEFSSHGINFVKNKFSIENECNRLVSIYNSIYNK